jgi:hypothetical protein
LPAICAIRDFSGSYVFICILDVSFLQHLLHPQTCLGGRGLATF